MSDREFFDIVRQRALEKTYSVLAGLTPTSSDGKMAPHVARERILRLRELAQDLNIIADVAEHL